MTKEELLNRITEIEKCFENVKRSVEETNIPVHVLISYIKEETNINITKS